MLSNYPLSDYPRTRFAIIRADYQLLPNIFLGTLTIKLALIIRASDYPRRFSSTRRLRIIEQLLYC